MSIMVAMGKGAGAGILFKNAESIEVLRDIDTLVVDKTGTLTEGKPRLVAVESVPGRDERELLRFAASLERDSRWFPPRLDIAQLVADVGRPRHEHLGLLAVELLLLLAPVDVELAGVRIGANPGRTSIGLRLLDPEPAVVGFDGRHVARRSRFAFALLAQPRAGRFDALRQVTVAARKQHSLRSHRDNGLRATPARDEKRLDKHRSRLDDSYADRVAHQSRGRMNTEFLHNLRTVRIRSLHAHAENYGDFLRRFTVGDQLEHLALTAGE
jgi:hypothetical protein